MDVEVLEPDGSVVIRRVSIKRGRLVSMLVEDEGGVKFFLNKVMAKFRPIFSKVPLENMQKAVKSPAAIQKILSAPKMRADDVLSPQILELERAMIPTPCVPGYKFPITV